jgi:hypothetical protein
MNVRAWFVIAMVLCALVAVAAPAGEGTKYGEGVSGKEVVAIAELLTDPDAYVGKTIRVEGKITDVCPRMGCWIEISENEATSIKFKVKDGVLVFKPDVKGKEVVAEGVFTRIDMTRDEAIDYAEHLAEEKGEPFDPSTVTEPYVFYQIAGKGALIR